ncbi:MAG: hypothetical protein EAX86_06360 [Candidatus Heimdallarchaeota archaeon]|nr:hypothetical protein [Candidatus Heimdallarchaeota archaeon]
MESEINQIQETIGKYVSGVTKGHHNEVMQAWHINGRRMIVDREQGQIIFENSPASAEYADLIPSSEVKQSAQIETIEHTSTTAYVKLKWTITSPHWKGKCIDYLLLVKPKDTWIIVSKVSHKE